MYVRKISGLFFINHYKLVGLLTLSLIHILERDIYVRKTSCLFFINQCKLIGLLTLSLIHILQNLIDISLIEIFLACYGT